MKKLSWSFLISPISVLLILSSSSLLFPKLTLANSVPLLLAQTGTNTPTAEGIGEQVKALMLQQNNLIDQANQQVLNILTPEQRLEWQAAQQEQREPKITLTDAQQNKVEAIGKSTETQLTNLEAQIKPLMDQLQQLVGQ